MTRIPAEDLFRQHAPWIARFLARLGAEPSSVEDMVQDVFLVAHRKGGYIPGAASPKTWLADIAQHVKSTANRTRRRRREQVDPGALASAVHRSPSPYEIAASTEGLARVQGFLDQLSEDQRAVFILFELEHEPLVAIAAGLGVPLGTVCSRLDNARQSIRRAYKKLESDRRRPGVAGRMPGGKDGGK
jgi:RNA polymerase sigma-70 factor (ECF subfamily)